MICVIVTLHGAAHLRLDATRGTSVPLYKIVWWPWPEIPERSGPNVVEQSASGTTRSRGRPLNSERGDVVRSKDGPEGDLHAQSVNARQCPSRRVALLKFWRLPSGARTCFSGPCAIPERRYGSRASGILTVDGKLCAWQCGNHLRRLPRSCFYTCRQCTHLGDSFRRYILAMDLSKSWDCSCCQRLPCFRTRQGTLIDDGGD